jgi:hypothetical protein
MPKILYNRKHESKKNIHISGLQPTLPTNANVVGLNFSSATSDNDGDDNGKGEKILSDKTRQELACEVAELRLQLKQLLQVKQGEIECHNDNTSGKDQGFQQQQEEEQAYK